MLESRRSRGLIDAQSPPSLPSWSREHFPPFSKAGASWLAASLLPWGGSLPSPLSFPRQRSLQSALSDGSCCSKSTSPALMWSEIAGSHQRRLSLVVSTEPGQEWGCSQGTASQLCFSRHCNVTKANPPSVSQQGSRDAVITRVLACSWSCFFACSTVVVAL